jgi:iron complex transport system substrate-binding protein
MTNEQVPTWRAGLVRTVAAVALVGLLVVGCGGDDGGSVPSTGATNDVSVATSAPGSTAGQVDDESTVASSAPEPSGSDASASDTAAPATTASDAAEDPEVILDPDAPDLGRVVALSEEFLLADLLALGIEPVASSATVDAVGFQGLDQYDTSAIEVLSQTSLSLEYLASLQPDTIITAQFFVDQVGEGVLDGIGELIVVPDGLSGADGIVALGELVGRPEHAAAVAAELDAAVADARAAVGDGCTLSLAVVYPGPTVAAFVDGPTALPRAFQEVGCELVPGPDVAAPDANGRAFLSEEQLGLLAETPLVLMQNERVEGESAALDEIGDSAIWRTLPAVGADRVVVIDRLGYPGATGLIRFFEELPAIVGA